MFQHRRTHPDNSQINALQCKQSPCNSFLSVSDSIWLRVRLSDEQSEDFNNFKDHLFTQLYIKMKSALILLLSTLFVIGVFGESESVSVSVKEGESQTLHTGITIQGSDEIEWSFNDKVIYVISSVGGEIKVSDQTDGAFGNRLDVNKQTGDLKFTNIKITDSGQYTLKISSTKGSSEKIFNVDVFQAHDETGEGLSSGTIAGIVIAVLLVVAAVGGIIYYFYRKKGQML